MAMKLAFSTLGCPEWDWTEIYPMAHDLGYAGIEIRGLGAEITASRAKPFQAGEIDRTVDTLKKLNLSISCFSSNCVLAAKDCTASASAEIGEYIELASKTGTPFVRVLADANPAPGPEVDDAAIVAILKSLAPKAKAKGVTLLVETNGAYGDTKRLARLLDAVGSDAVAALWDIHHPYRFFRESPETTWKNLDGRIKYVHAKDSILDDSGKILYRMPGAGDLPLTGALDVLSAGGYAGFVSLEWVKRWASEIEDAAVVFPKFVAFFREWEAKKAGKPAGAIAHGVSGATEERAARNYRVPGPVGSESDENIRYVEPKDGKSIWPKDELIEITFGKMLEKVVETFPNQTAFAYTTRNYTRTYAEFLEDVDRAGRMFLAMGVKKGDHVAIWATNDPHWFITFWAAVRIGAVLVTVNTAYKIHEAEYILKQSDTKTLVLIDGFKDSNYVQILNEIAPELAGSEPGKLNAARLPVLRNVITVDTKIPGAYHWDEALAMADAYPEDAIRKMQDSLDPHEVCNMQYTSGTTGFPKGVMLTHHNVVNNGKCIGDCMHLTTADRYLIQVPMFHCFGMVLSMTSSMTHGSTMVPVEYFSPKVVMPAFTKRKITAVNGVPTMFIAILEHPDFATTDFSHLRTGIMAGSPCPIPVMEAVVDKMGMKDITIVFGQTESSPGCTQSRVGDPLEVRVGTVGRALPGVECKIVDPATGEDCPDNVDGEFVARGYNIMKGYYNMSEATKAAIDANGWLHTGDLARRTPEGNYKITGRIKDMIIRGGENIYPKEIEEFLYKHPAVRDVQVIGVPDIAMGEEIMACVILKEGATITVDELKEHVRSHMAKHKTPKYVEFVDSFPMNAAGKIMKYKMRDWAVEKLGLQKAAAVETA